MAFRDVRQRRPRRPLMDPPPPPLAAAGTQLGPPGADPLPSPIPPSAGAPPPLPPSGTCRATLLGIPPGIRLALAGGLSGAAVHTALHPLDTLKTVRQADPALRSATLRSALAALLERSRPPGGAGAGAGGAAASASAAAAAGAAARSAGGRPPPPALLAVLPTLYRGVVPAALGAAPSSALYFGMYEAAKRALHARYLRPAEPGAPGRRLALNCLSAAAGNVASSVVFVPKEVIKQRLQTGLSPSVPAAVASLVAGGGLRALYRGYGVTLARNIPSAVLKFSLYEEAKVALRNRKAAAAAAGAPTSVTGGGGGASVQLRQRWGGIDHVLCGAVAGAMASGLTTPLDVVKTRFAVLGGNGRGAWAVARSVVAEGGVGGLFAGVQPRMVWSALFTAMGFGTYEAFKRLLVPEGVAGEGGQTPSGHPRGHAAVGGGGAVTPRWVAGGGGDPCGNPMAKPVAWPRGPCKAGLEGWGGLCGTPYALLQRGPWPRRAPDLWRGARQKKGQRSLGSSGETGLQSGRRAQAKHARRSEQELAFA